MTDIKFQFQEPHSIINSNLDLKEKKVKLQILHHLLSEELNTYSQQRLFEDINDNEQKLNHLKKLKSSLEDEISFITKQSNELKTKGEELLTQINQLTNNTLLNKYSKMILFVFFFFFILSFSYQFIFILFILSAFLFLFIYRNITQNKQNYASQLRQPLNETIESYKITKRLLSTKEKQKETVLQELTELSKKQEELIHSKKQLLMIKDHIKYTTLYLTELKSIN